MKIVVDESVDFGIVNILRKKGVLVISILEQKSGITDKEVLQISILEKSLLITEDKDFGELAYRLRLTHFGILLIRLSELPRLERIELASETIIKYYERLNNHFPQQVACDQ